MRIIVTGSRDWTDRASVWTPLDGQRLLHATPETPLEVVDGMADDGADFLVAEWAKARETLHVTLDPHPADWRPKGRFNPAAGFDRNQEMIDSGGDKLMVWAKPCRAKKPSCPPGVHPSHGTADCVRRARQAKMPVFFCPLGMSW